MKKILFIANSDRHIKLCHIPYMQLFQENGYKVHVITNTDEKIKCCDKKYSVNFKRNPFKIQNFISIFKVRKIIKEQGYSILSCHTPVGGFLGRCSCIGLKNKPVILYTAHGFHFYKGSSKIYWILYFTLEKFLSRFTNAVITMNKEDYDIASKKFHCDVYKTNGIGLIDSRLKLTNKNIRKELKLENKYIVTFVAEISKRKNQIKFLKVLKKHEVDKDIHFVLVGDSNINNFDKMVSKYDNVTYVGFVDNVGDYINASDLIFSPSIQEGLPQNILEALYFNKMVIALNIRGNRDLINKNNGILVNNLDELIDEVVKYKNSKPKKINNNIDKYKINHVIKEYNKIINNYIDDIK